MAFQRFVRALNSCNHSGDNRLALDNPEILAKVLEIGLAHLEAEARSGSHQFESWSTRMVEAIGERARPHLFQIYVKVTAEFANRTMQLLDKLEYENSSLSRRLKQADTVSGELLRAQLNRD